MDETKNMNIPFYDYPRNFLDEKSELMKIFEDVGTRGAFIMQRDLSDFELQLASFVNSKHAIGVANATDGLELSLLAIGLKPGDEVICSAHTMLATASAIKTAGGIPVPVEIGYDNLIDPEAIENAINTRTVGIMPTQLNGRTCNMEQILGIASKKGLFVVEDAAQALGSKFKGKCAGTFGIASAISFFPAKVMGCLGDGGAVITSDPRIFDVVYQLHDHGRDINGDVKSWGRNSRLDNLSAAILSYRLSNYSNVIARRRKIAQIYENELSVIEELKLPPGPNDSPDHFDIYQNYELEAENRDLLKNYLKENGIGTLIQWGGKAIHQWNNLGFNQKLPVTDNFFKKCIMLPMNTFIADEDVYYICDKVKEFYHYN